MEMLPGARDLCLVILEAQTKDGHVRFEYYWILDGALQLCGRSKPLQPLDVDQALEELNELREQCQRQEQGKLLERPFEALEHLADQVFGAIAPVEGLPSLLQRIRGAHNVLVPRLTLSVSGALGRRVPWEMWRLECLQCSGCGLYYTARDEPSTDASCFACKQTLQHKRVALFDCAELSHVPAGELLCAGAAQHRDKFVIVVGELSPADAETFSPHIAFVDRRARALFGEDAVVFLALSQATVKNVKALLRAPDVRGLYYFGHADNKGLKLHKAQYLTVEAVSQAQPAIPFVFLNACYAAASDLSETKLALAFAGTGKLVVAPTTEVMASHAAEFAESFFHVLHTQACEPSESLSCAYRSPSKHGVSPILGVYRRFGALPVPLVPARTARTDSIFSRPVKGVLDPERFSFDIAGVLSYAQLTSREARVETRHLLAGLLRKGQLTRHLVRGLVLEPDRLINEVAALRPAGPQVEKPPRFGRENLSEAVQQVLQEARTEAAMRGEDKVAERDVLAQLLRAPELVHAGFWRRDISPADLLACLQDTYHVSSFDADGGLFLGDLSQAATRVVRGVVRQLAGLLDSKWTLDVDEDAIWLWAFLEEPGGCAHEYCRAYGIEPNIVLGLLRNELGLPIQGDSDHAARPEATVQSPMALAQAVVPVLHTARAEAHRQITEHQLLAVYCKRASGKLKVMLERQAELVLNDFTCKCLGPKSTLNDLPDELRSSLSACTNHARAVLLRFWNLALELNSCSNRVLLAAFLDQNDEVATGELSSKAEHDTRKELSEYLAERSRLPAADEQIHKRLLSDVIKRLVEGAGKHRAQEVDARSLFTEFKSQCPRSFRDGLRELPRYAWRVAVVSIV